MVTISDKRFGELVANTLLFETYRSIANSQYEVIQKQDEASRAGMKEIKRLREELAVSKACEQRLIDELAATREKVEYWKQVVKDVEKAVVFWREKFTEKLSYSKALEGVLEGVKNSVKDL